MARNLSSAGTSPRVQNHHYGCFVVIWHLTRWIRGPGEWKMIRLSESCRVSYYDLDLGNRSFLGFICHASHWGEPRFKGRGIKLHLSVRTRKEFTTIFNITLVILNCVNSSEKWIDGREGKWFYVFSTVNRFKQLLLEWEQL